MKDAADEARDLARRLMLMDQAFQRLMKSMGEASNVLSQDVAEGMHKTNEAIKGVSDFSCPGAWQNLFRSSGAGSWMSI